MSALPTYTPEFKARVAELYLTRSAREIAEILQSEGLSVTRNSIIGLCFRMGLKSTDKEKIHPSTSRRFDPRPRAEKAPGIRKPAKISNVIRIRPPTRKMRQADVEPLNLSLLELPRDACRYIAGDDYLYCGHPQQPGSSYCEAHHALVWVPPHSRPVGNRTSHGRSPYFASKPSAWSEAAE